MRNERGQFVKGITPWNKGTKGIMKVNSQSAHMRFHKNPKNVKPSEIIFDGCLL